MRPSKTCSYFDREISNGKSTMRLFGFEGSVRRKLLACKSSSVGVVLSSVISLLNSQSSSLPLNSFPSQSSSSVSLVLHRTTTVAADAEHNVLGGS